VAFNCLADSVILAHFDCPESACGYSAVTRRLRRSTTAPFARCCAKKRLNETPPSASNMLNNIPEKKAEAEYAISHFALDEIRDLFKLPGASARIGQR
jgi:hypothetical protein